MEKEDADNLVDRISELPDELLVRILSSLSLKEAARTGVVSRRWRDLWQLVTGSLSFEFPDTLPISERDRCVDWISRVLNSHKAPTIDELRVSCNLTKPAETNITRWIEIALMKKVKRLELDLLPVWCVDRYRLEWVFCGSSGLKFLTSLRLKHVQVNGHVLESFLSNCPLLETLHVSHSTRLTALNVYGSSLSLKHLHISSCAEIHSIEVYAPKLVTFEFSGNKVHLDLKNVPQLRDVSYEAEWDEIEGVGNPRFQVFPSGLATCASQLVNLSLKFMNTTEIDSCPILPNLRYLTCEVLVLSDSTTKGLLCLLALVDSSPLLHKFKVEVGLMNTRRSEVSKVIEDVETMIKGRRGHEMLSLREVVIVGFLGVDADTALLTYLLKSTLNLEYIVIRISTSNDWSWYNRNGDGPISRATSIRLAHHLLWEYRPQGAKFLVL